MPLKARLSEKSVRMSVGRRLKCWALGKALLENIMGNNRNGSSLREGDGNDTEAAGASRLGGARDSLRIAGKGGSQLPKLRGTCHPENCNRAGDYPGSDSKESQAGGLRQVAGQL